VLADFTVHKRDAGEFVVAERAAVEGVEDLVAVLLTGSPINNHEAAKSRSDAQLLADLAGTRRFRGPRTRRCPGPGHAETGRKGCAHRRRPGEAARWGPRSW